MSTHLSAAQAAGLSMLQQSAHQFQITQKRVATGRAVFSAADDAARFSLSSRLLSRSRLLNLINNNISLVLKTLETTEQTLQSMLKLVDQGLDIASRAQDRGTGGFQGTRSTTDINADTLVSTLAVPGSRFTIAMDGGQSFTYTFGATANTTRWGTIVDALNSANIGLIAEYIPATAPSINNLRFRSVSGRDFRFGGDSDQNVIAALGAITSGTGGTLNLANQFVLGAAAPTAAQTGFTISFGGAAQSAVNVTAATAIAAGSSITFGNPAGQYYTWSTVTATTVGAAIAGINGMNAGVIAELANSGAGTTVLRLRSSAGHDLEVAAGAGAFIGPTGTVRFGTSSTIQQTGFREDFRADHAIRLMYGTQYDNILANLPLLARHNPVPGGANLLAGQSLNLIVGEVASVLNVDGRDITANSALGLNQAGSTWTTFGNLVTSIQQATSARALLVDLSGQIGVNQRLLAERYAINRDFAGSLGFLGDELTSADLADESAKLAALQVQQDFTTQAMLSGTAHSELLTQLLE